MNEEKKKKLIETIKKSGFPTEIEVTNIFKSKKWFINQNPFYIDLDENKGREIDLITGYTPPNQTYEDEYLEATIYFIVEIKKEVNKPWVVFTSDSSDFQRKYRLPRNVNQTNFSRLAVQKSFKEHNQEFLGRIGRTAFEGFSTGKDKLYGSLYNVTKAFYHFKNESYILRDESDDKLLAYYEPLIVFEGDLVEAYLDGDEVNIEEKQYLQIEFNYLSPSYKKQIRSNIIHIVRKDYLEEYIDIRQNQFDDIFKSMSKIEEKVIKRRTQ